jgi:hypothetical protein
LDSRFEHDGSWLRRIVASSTSVASAAPGAPAGKIFEFPSASSTVVGSGGFINDCEVGYFWSAGRGDGVAQTFKAGTSITRERLAVEVVQNALSGGNEVDWNIVINGVVVDSFVVSEGFTGEIDSDKTFAKIKGRKYHVELRVTNEVPVGGGSVTLAYACSFAHVLIVSKH